MRVAVVAKIAALVPTLLLAGPVTIGTAQEAPSPEPETVWTFTEPLVPGDAIRLVFWREPELNGDYLIDGGGVATLPIIGPTHVVGLAPNALKDSLTAAYLTQVRNQNVQITLMRRIRVVGSVVRPGLYFVDSTNTLGDALALAGGLAPDGKREAVLVRDGEEIVKDLTFGYGLEHLQSGDQIFVPQQNWLSRNSSALALGLVSTLAIIGSAWIWSNN